MHSGKSKTRKGRNHTKSRSSSFATRSHISTNPSTTIFVVVAKRVVAALQYFFLAFAARDGFIVDRYQDEARGTLGRDDRGRMAITGVTLRPAVAFADEAAPDPAALADLHHRAHEDCYIANSIRAGVTVEPR